MTALIELYANNANATLSASITNVQTTLYLTTGEGAKFPNPVSGTQFFRIAVTSASSPDTVLEIMYCTARVGDTLTVIRGQEGTTASGWSVLDLVANVATAGTYQQFVQPFFGIDTGATNSYVVSTPQAYGAYFTGMPCVWYTANSNTSTTPTLNVNGLGAAVIKCGDGSAVLAGQIKTNEVLEVLYNANDSSWRIQTPTYSSIVAELGYAPVKSVNGYTGIVNLIVSDIPGAAPIASPTFTGIPAAPTASPGNNSTQLATTSFVATSFAPINSPTFTGVPAAPTPAPGDSTTKLATTAFVDVNARPWTYVNSAITVKSEYYNVDTTAGTFTLTLPAAPATGVTITFMDANGHWTTTPWTLSGNGHTIMGYSTPLSVNVSDQEFTIWYNGSDWRLV